MLTPEILAKLTPEQKEIAEKWEKERKEVDALLDSLEASDLAGNLEEGNKILLQIVNRSSTICAHGRLIASSCLACDELEMILYPELFDEEGNRREMFLEPSEIKDPPNET